MAKNTITIVDEITSVHGGVGRLINLGLMWLGIILTYGATIGITEGFDAHLKMPKAQLHREVAFRTSRTGWIYTVVFVNMSTAFAFSCVARFNNNF